MWARSGGHRRGLRTMEDLEFNEASREHLATWERLKSIMLYCLIFVLIIVGGMAFFLTP